MVLDVDTMNNEGICFHSIKRIYDKRVTYCPCIKVEEFLLIVFILLMTLETIYYFIMKY